MSELSTQKSERLLSLDALRGFDMFWIAGGEVIIAAIAKYTHWPVFNWLHIQMEHAEWNGFHFYDLIFPLFGFKTQRTGRQPKSHLSAFIKTVRAIDSFGHDL